MLLIREALICQIKDFLWNYFVNGGGGGGIHFMKFFHKNSLIGRRRASLSLIKVGGRHNMAWAGRCYSEGWQLWFTSRQSMSAASSTISSITSSVQKCVLRTAVSSCNLSEGMLCRFLLAWIARPALRTLFMSEFSHTYCHYINSHTKEDDQANIHLSWTWRADWSSTLIGELLSQPRIMQVTHLVASNAPADNQINFSHHLYKLHLVSVSEICLSLTSEARREIDDPS